MIRTGKEGEGRSVRVEDVAREAGVSPITVSRTLSAPEKVRPETRERVLDAVARTGYVVNSIASTLRSGRSSIVTVFTASLQNPHFASAIQGTIDAFDGSRFRLMFAQTGYTERLRAEVIEGALPFRPAALMFTGLVRNEATREAVRRIGVPVVEMWGDSSDPIDLMVGSSAFEGGRLMGEHFAQRGYRHVCYCGAAVDRGGERLRGFRAGLAQSGAPDVELVMSREGTRSFADGMSAFEQITRDLPQCDAIFFSTDLMAAGAMVAASRHTLEVPGRIAIAGYGDLDFAAFIDPGLTSVDVSDYDMGRLAGGMLRRRLEGGLVDNPVIQVPVKLEVRGSTAPR